ncbi:FeoB-associated Cys-rich membrane protein [Thermoflavimicrobium dichotomicum]|uniref:Virus attachment protein p12 family protein n=1 Tax=Thermoflavimicrobium dichotomicum TaxID=46223 RepID=A0A1I3U2R7_9BACL|nr:FeoB-associated Cys-rich membrane protein [Thermoflavimicrobium dichotomicum]SFJ76829.1 Virus attachment protein p12 family protein [Thermoflavimicrobium dichotomicum]
MVINFLLGTLIFGYSGWVLYRYFQKTKQSKCAACSVKESCAVVLCNQAQHPNKDRS